MHLSFDPMHNRILFASSFAFAVYYDTLIEMEPFYLGNQRVHFASTSIVA